MYIVHRDAVGRRFVALLAERARAGITVRVIYDWFGCGWGPLLGLFRPLIAAGGEVRVFNPPRLSAALGWTRRDHRKLHHASTAGSPSSAGSASAQAWEGRPDEAREPWRDTGVEIVGPGRRAPGTGVRGELGSWPAAQPLTRVRRSVGTGRPATFSLRVIPTEPFTAALLRTDLLVTTLARRTLWISDAYFIGHGPFVAGAAARGRATAWTSACCCRRAATSTWTVPLSRSLYRVLLEAGVRIFEWNGTMMHAKTAVADGRWSRIGSTNLNLNSWVGNWELDVADRGRGRRRGSWSEHYEEDLEHVDRDRDGRAAPHRSMRARATRDRARRSARRALRAITGLGHSLSAAVMGSRELEEWELAPLFAVGLLVTAIAVLALFFPTRLRVARRGPGGLGRRQLHRGVVRPLAGAEATVTGRARWTPSRVSTRTARGPIPIWSRSRRRSSCLIAASAARRRRGRSAC